MRGQEGRKKMPYLEESYDIVVVGAGHAGCEAALACARLGLETIMFTVSVDSIALMPCNPNIGGSSKGHLVRELDALGGEMGKNIDKTFIQSKMLNESKGPAVHSLRAQADKQEYSRQMRKTMENTEHLLVLMENYLPDLYHKNNLKCWWDGWRCMRKKLMLHGTKLSEESILIKLNLYSKEGILCLL